MADDTPEAPPPSYDEAIKSSEGQPGYNASGYGMAPPYPPAGATFSQPPYSPPGAYTPHPLTGSFSQSGAYPVGSGPITAPYPQGGPYASQYGPNVTAGQYNGPQQYTYNTVTATGHNMAVGPVNPMLQERKRRIMCMVLFIFAMVIVMIIITNVIAS